MGLLIGVAFVAGVVTAISPCVLPVLPIVFAGSATGGKRRPYAVVAGLVVSFTVFTLTAAALLSALGLPDDLLRNIAIGVVLVMALGLLWPPFGHVLERPFQALGRRRPSDSAGGFFLGVNLGVLFTPCAGPIIAAIATLAASKEFSLAAVLITLSYAAGAGAVLLGFALAARRGLALHALRSRAPVVRRSLGLVMVAAAALMIAGLDIRLATHVPGYTRALQHFEESASAQSELDELVGGEGTRSDEGLSDYGPAPEFREIQEWLNSPPLTLAGLRGKVVVLDFWTYSCVNCLRTLPYIRRWYSTYRDKGLVIVGVHTPEFSFERVPGNVRRAVSSLGVDYAVALDNDYATWNAWGNRYWPAKYFIDRRGNLRFFHFGEGEYERSESVIRTLLAEKKLPAPVSRSVHDRTPTDVETPETYLGYDRLDRFVGAQLVRDLEAGYRIPPAVPQNSVAYGGRWTVEAERIVAGAGARLRLAYHARNVHLVLGTAAGQETVTVTVDGDVLRTVEVTEDRLYTLVARPGPARDHILDVRFSPGTEAYAFTFG